MLGPEGSGRVPDLGLPSCGSCRFRSEGLRTGGATSTGTPWSTIYKIVRIHIPHVYTYTWVFFFCFPV